MAAIIPNASTFNPSSLSADDLYIVIQNPPGFIRGVPTDVMGLVGSASWGPVNQPVHMGGARDALVAFGPISSAALTDPFDLATDLALAFGQATSLGGNEGWAVRVTDGTDVAASAAIPGAATSASETVTVGGTAHSGDNLNLTFTSTAVAGSPLTITYVMKAADTLATGAAGLAAAINANAVLTALGVNAKVAGAVVSVYQPTSLSPQITYTETVTGTGATTTLTLASGAAVTAGCTLSGVYTGIIGNGLQLTMQAGAGTNTFTALLAIPALGLQEAFTNIAGGATFWPALASAINNGQSGVRGPSAIARASNANAAVGTPTLATTTCTGGTDGRTGVVTATLLGSDSAQPRTGLYALRQQQPAVGIVWLVGCTDPTSFPSLLSFAQTEGATALAPFATGTSTTTAVAAVATNGIHDPAFMYVKDWIYWFDPVNALVRLSPPTAVIGGLGATQGPQVNWGNTPTSMVIGTERFAPTGSQPYTQSEIGQLANAGISLITNPIPAGSQFGIRTAQTTSLNAATAGVEWWRTTVFLARSIASTMGQFVDQNQSQQPNDPLRAAVKNQLNTFLQSLVGNNGAPGVIDAYTVNCTLNTSPTASPGNGVNTPASIAQHFLFVLVRVTYLSSVRFFIIALQGGTTVVTVGSTPGQQIAA